MTDAKLHREADDLWAGLVVSEWAALGHADLLLDAPVGLKRRSFDTTEAWPTDWHRHISRCRRQGRR
jgi:hypothetical protein